MRRGARHALLPACWAMALGLLVAGTARADWLRRGVNDGLAGAAVHGIAEARDGTMWFATSGGASHFDGVRWETVRDSLVDPASSLRTDHEARAVAADSAGGLWFGTLQNGVARFDGVRWSYATQARGSLADDQVNALLCDHAGDLWVGTVSGLARYQPALDRWTIYRPGASALVDGRVLSLVEDAKNALWVGTGVGANRIDSLRSPAWDTFTSALVAAGGSDSVLALGATRDGAVWFGTERGVIRDSAGVWSHYGLAEGTGSDSLIALLGTRRGDLWAGGRNHGLARFDGRDWSSQQAIPDGTGFGGINALYEDSRHDLWVGTQTGGVLRSDGVEWLALTGVCHNAVGGCPRAPAVPAIQALPDPWVTAVLEDAAGETWVATHDYGAARRLTNGAWSPFPTPQSNQLRCLFEDSARRLWFGSDDGGLARLDPGRTQWTSFDRLEGLPSDSIAVLIEDHAGVLWAGGHGGVARFDGAAWTPQLLGPQAEGGSIVQLQEDRDGDLWARSDLGVLYRDSPGRDGFAVVGAADGLAGGLAQAMALDPSGALTVVDSSRVLVAAGGLLAPRPDVLPPYLAGWPSARSLHFDHLGRLWIVGANGTARVDPASGEVTSFPGGFAGGAIVGYSDGGFLEDESGTVWIATDSGLNRYNGSTWRTYGEADGVPNGAEPSILRRDRRGDLWFGGLDGLAVYAPDRAAPWTTLVPRPDSVVAQRTIDYRMGVFSDDADERFLVTQDGTPLPPTLDPHLSIAGWLDGPHTYSAAAEDWAGNVDPRPVRGSFVLDSTAPAPVIDHPLPNDAVRDTVAITGRVDDARLAAWALTVCRADSGTCLPETLAQGTTAVTGALAAWPTRGLAEGVYTLVLRETDRLGLVGSVSVPVQVDNQPPFAGVSTPRTIGNAVGGDVYSIPGDVHLYFPPHAFAPGTNEAVVSLTRADTSLALPVSASLRGQAYDVAWSPEALRHDAEIDFACDAPTSTRPESIAVYRWRADTGWQRLGGTRDAATGRVSSATGLPGRFALLGGAAAPFGPAAVVSLAVAPRVFSPAGVASPVAPGPAPGGAAIVFSLARPGPATVAVYDRAGHLVRRLTDGEGFPAGMNVVRWDGRDRDGRAAPDGPYIVVVTAFGATLEKTVAVVR